MSETAGHSSDGGMNSDDAIAAVVMQAMLECANAWRGDARLVGNVRAQDMRRAICEWDAEITTLRAQLEEARAKAIEECAQVAERHTGMTPSGCMEYGSNMPKLIAAAIRALLPGTFIDAIISAAISEIEAKEKADG